MNLKSMILKAHELTIEAGLTLEKIVTVKITRNGLTIPNSVYSANLHL